MPRFVLVYHPLGSVPLSEAKATRHTTTEDAAVRFAQSESGILGTTVSLWMGANLIAAFTRGKEADLTPVQYHGARARAHQAYLGAA